MRIGLMTAASIAALLASAGPAAAQPAWSGEGALTDSDPQMSEGNRYDDHRLQLQAGQRYRISVDSSDFDPVARLIRVGQEQPVAENDDSAGLNPRINYTPAEGGDYILRVYGYSADGRG
ncbi:MAG: PPC domain-containing protein, partial [Sphingomonas sp.]